MGERTEEPWDLVIGQVTAPFGINGELRVRPETDYPERFLELKEVAIELPSGELEVFQVKQARLMPKGITLSLRDCERREEAELLRGAWVKIKQSMAMTLPEDSYWLHDIIGLRVMNEQGENLGEIAEIIRSPGNDVYVTPKAMIPAVRQVVRSVDLKKREMIVSLPLEETREV